MNLSKERQQIATSYKQLIQQGYFNEPFGGNESYLGKLMTAIIPDEASSLLEIGGATGLWAAQMLKERSNIQELTAVEISDAAQTYEQRILGAGKKNLKLNVIQADFLQIAPELKKADVVVSSFVAQYMYNPSDYIRQLYELTQPNGCVIFVDKISLPKADEMGISSKIALQSFVLVSLTHWNLHCPIPLEGFIRSAALAKLYQEPAFQILNDYHDSYSFPIDAWKAEQDKYPKASFYNLGLGGLLVLHKPSH